MKNKNEKKQVKKEAKKWGKKIMIGKVKTDKDKRNEGKFKKNIGDMMDIAIEKTKARKENE